MPNPGDGCSPASGLGLGHPGYVAADVGDPPAQLDGDPKGLPWVGCLDLLTLGAWHRSIPLPQRCCNIFMILVYFFLFVY